MSDEGVRQMKRSEMDTRVALAEKREHLWFENYNKAVALAENQAVFFQEKINRQGAELAALRHELEKLKNPVIATE
jgi:hypothetical protein